jgi:hypothetical protein
VAQFAHQTGPGKRPVAGDGILALLICRHASGRPGWLANAGHPQSDARRDAQANSRCWQRIAGHLASQPLPAPARQIARRLGFEPRPSLAVFGQIAIEEHAVHAAVTDGNPSAVYEAARQLRPFQPETDRFQRKVKQKGYGLTEFGPVLTEKRPDLRRSRRSSKLSPVFLRKTRFKTGRQQLNITGLKAVPRARPSRFQCQRRRRLVGHLARILQSIVHNMLVQPQQHVAIRIQVVARCVTRLVNVQTTKNVGT